MYDFLSIVAQQCDVLFSEKIDKGEIWGRKISDSLADSSYGIACMTPDALGSDWIHYEAGALAKAIDEKQRVVPYLVKVRNIDLKGPLISRSPRASMVT